MKPQDVGKSYDSLAEFWHSEKFSRENGIEAHKRAVAFAEARGRALDIGCGSSGRILDLLLDYGFEAEGLDISPKMLGMAKVRHPDVTFHEADICEWQFPGRYDFISAWDSIWHVPLEQQPAVLSKILGGLSPGGVFIFTAGGTDSPAETRDSAMGPPMYTSTLGIPGILELLRDAGCHCRHLEYDQHPELHVYIIAQRA